MSRRWIPLVTLVAGCGSAAPRPRPQLADTLSYVEVTAEGDRHAIDGTGLARVDINSRIEVIVDHAKVAALVQGASKPDPVAIAAMEQQLGELAELTERQTAIVRKLASLTERLGTEDKAKLAVESAELGELEREVARLVNDYATGAGIDTDRFYAHKGTAIAALDAERTRVLEEADRLASPGGDLRWRIQGVFARGTPIHLPNYDTHADGPFAVINKLAPRVEKLPAQREEATQLAENLGDLGNATTVLIGAVATNIKNWVAALEEAAGKDFAALDEAVQEMTDAMLSVTEVKALKVSIEALGADLVALRAPCAPILRAIAKGSIADVTLARGQSCAKALDRTGPALVKDAKAAANALGTVATMVAKSDPKLVAVLAPLKELVTRLETVRLLEQWATRWEQQKQAVSRVLGVATNVVPPTWTADKQTDVELTAVIDTTVDLRRTERDEGDLFFVRPSLVTTTGTTVFDGAASDFEVVRMGTYLEVSAGVAFVDARDDEWGSFSAAPGVTAAVHYRVRSTRLAGRTWNALRPGVALHFLYPDLGSDAMGETDPSFELGVGGSLLLFGDLLQVGVGYDIQVDQSYWYLGFGLETLAKLGVRFSP